MLLLRYKSEISIDAESYNQNKMKILSLLLACCVLSLNTNATEMESFTSSADSFLKKYVNTGIVSYSRINKNEIKALYNCIGAMSLAGQSTNSKKAFYINAYNLIVIYSILQHYPVKSPMDIQGFFDKISHKVAGEQLTLNSLEKEKLLSAYNDARFHFVLVCAAKSCPPLLNGAFFPDQIEKQLQQRTMLTINDNAWLKTTPSQKKIEVSKIFEWYNGDFTKAGSSLISWINKFRKIQIPNSYSVSYYEYDWSLNE